jgi:hypothetical protein
MNRRLAVVGALVVVGGVFIVAACNFSPGTAPNTEEKEEVQGPPLFKDVTADSGLHAAYRNGEEAGHLAILESLGGGVALLDFDGDGLLDVFVPGGGFYGSTAEQFRKDRVRPTINGHPGKLFRNLGNFRFKDVTREVMPEFNWFYSHGCAVGDYDRDGWPDLLVTGWGRVALFHNEPVDPKDPAKGRKFVDVTDKAGLKGITWASSAAFADYDGDGYPDLYVCQYADWSFANHPTCSYDGKTADVCPPKQFSGLQHKLFRNNADGTFTDVTEEAGLAKGGREVSKGLGVLAVDVNGDGKPDIYVANDTVDKFLYVNHSTPGKFRFTEEGFRSGAARDPRGQVNGSMGLAAGDYDGSGVPSLWVTNYEKELHALYRNESKGDKVLFTFQTEAAGIAAIGQKYVGWGTGFLDVDHHGWEDLFVANGHAIRYPMEAGVTRAQKPVLLRNEGGKFKNITRQGGDYFRAAHVSRGVALGDLDNDGRTDLVISNINEPVAVLRNVADAGNHWLGVQLVGKYHADVVGARVVLEVDGGKQTRFAVGGGSYASACDTRHVFGLGKAGKVGRLTVTWPASADMHSQTFDGLDIDRYYRITQGKAEAEPLGDQK